MGKRTFPPRDPGYGKRRRSRNRARVAGPIPGTRRRSSGVRKAPLRTRSSSMRAARAGPTPGRDSSSLRVARFTSTPSPVPRVHRRSPVPPRSRPRPPARAKLLRRDRQVGPEPLQGGRPHPRDTDQLVHRPERAVRLPGAHDPPRQCRPHPRETGELHLRRPVGIQGLSRGQGGATPLLGRQGGPGPLHQSRVRGGIRREEGRRAPDLPSESKEGSQEKDGHRRARGPALVGVHGPKLGGAPGPAHGSLGRSAGAGQGAGSGLRTLLERRGPAPFSPGAPPALPRAPFAPTAPTGTGCSRCASR
jgi:hypothetical protein